MPEREYGRKFLRIKPENPLHADITIVQIGTKRVMTGAARVRILNMSPGGLKFTSPLSFPADQLVLIEIQFNVMDQTFRLKGHILYKSCVEVSEYEYGFAFSEADEVLRTCLKKLFNNTYIKMTRHILILRFDR